MTALFEIGLINAVLATLLAIGVWLATRVWRQPVLVHALWVVVLVKLVTPPMITIPWRLAGVPDVALVRAEPLSRMSPVQTEMAPMPLRIAESAEFLPQTALEAAEAKATHTAAANEVPRLASTEFQPQAASRRTLSWTTMTAAAWLSGIVIFSGITLGRLLRFHRALADAAPAPLELRELAERVATRFAVRGFQLRVTQGRVSPLVWPVGRPTIVLPRLLLAELSPAETETLLAHELAHLRRKDHWVRWLELVSVAIYWWHPVAWWARTMIRRSEERACDAWVVWAFPDSVRRYASALFTTVEFVSTSRSNAPLVASRLDSGGNLKERIENIMSGNCHRRLSLLHKLSLLCLALVVLPLSLRAIHAAEEPPTLENTVGDVPAERVTSEPQSTSSEPSTRPKLELEIERRLQTPVSVQFVDAPIEEVMAALSESAGVDIHLDHRALGEEGIATDMPITIKLKSRVSLRSALNLILKPLHLHYVIEDEVLKVTNAPRRAVPATGAEATANGAVSSGLPALGATRIAESAIDHPPAPEEIEVLRQHASFLEERFKAIEAKHQTGSRGGSQDVRDMTGYEMATAQAQVALAEGRRDEAAARLKEAEEFAESGLQSAEANYEAGRITNDMVLQAANNLAESKRRLLQLRKALAATTNVSPRTTHYKTKSNRETAQTTPAADSSLSIGVIKKIVEGRKQYYERSQSLAQKNLVSASELDNSKNEYETSVARYEQALRALKYNQLLVELAEIEYQEALEKNKTTPKSVSEFELRKLRIKLELAKAKLNELAE